MTKRSLTIRLLLLGGFLLASLSTFGQTLAGVNGDCQIGGEQALTSGLPSTATQQIGTTNVNAGAGVQASFPGCIVTVYATGTLTKANIFSDNNPTPTVLVNPFVANVDGSFTFFVAQGACYDITMSSGSVPQPYPRTLTDVCEGGSGGGGSANLNGTLNHVIKFTNPTSGGDSEGIATGIAPATWPLGLGLVTAPLETSFPNSVVPGTTQYLLVSLDSGGNARLSQPTDTNNLIGIADGGAGVTGFVNIAYSGQFQCTFDNQTAINDWVVLGSGSQCHDAGATEPVGVQNIARVDSVNAGTGTNASVHLGLPDVTAPQPSGGSGTVSPCATVGAIAYYAATGNVVSCDPLFTTDGAGDFNAISGTFSGPTAGFVAWGAGSAPSTVASSVVVGGPTTVSTPYAILWPSAEGTANQVLSIASVTSHIQTMQWASGSGAHGLSFTVGLPGGTAISPGSTATDYLTIPFGCTIGAYNLAIDTGTITVKFWKIATGTAIPTVSNSINTSGVSIASGTAIHSATLTDFTTTTVTANDIMAMNVTAAAGGAAFVNGVLQCQ